MFLSVNKYHTMLKLVPLSRSISDSRPAMILYSITSIHCINNN